MKNTVIKTVIELANRPLTEFPIEKQLEEIQQIFLKINDENPFTCEKVDVENGLVTCFNYFEHKTEQELKDEQLSIIAELSPLLPDGTFFWTKTNDDEESVLLSDNYNPSTNQNDQGQSRAWFLSHG